MDHSPKAGGNRIGWRIIRNTLLLLACSAVLAAQGQKPAAAQTSTSYTQVVNRADPHLTWTTPQPIPLGTALGPAQLTASARTPGTFRYTPATGTVLRSGTYTISVTFVPDSLNFTGATASVTLTVEPPNGSSFSLQLAQGASQGYPILLDAGQQASVPLLIVPVGDFQQPVSMTCTAPEDALCTLTPLSVRPTVAPLPVTLHIQGPTPAVSHGAGFTDWPALCASIALLLAMRPARRRLRMAPWAWLGLSALLWIPLCAATLGCGVTRTGAQVTIHAASLTETKSLELSFVPWVDPTP